MHYFLIYINIHHSDWLFLHFPPGRMRGHLKAKLLLVYFYWFIGQQIIWLEMWDYFDKQILRTGQEVSHNLNHNHNYIFLYIYIYLYILKHVWMKIFCLFIQIFIHIYIYILIMCRIPFCQQMGNAICTHE